MRTLYTECAIPAKEASSPWWLDPTTVDQMASPQPERDLRDHTHVIHLTFTHSFHLTLFSPVAPKTGAAPLTFQHGPTLLPLIAHGPPFLPSFGPSTRVRGFAPLPGPTLGTPPSGAWSGCPPSFPFRTPHKSPS